MATKIIILGSEENKQTKRPIEFVKILTSSGIISYADSSSETHKPSFYENIELISRDYTNNSENFDLIFAYRKDRNEKLYSVLFLGYFNDGIVE